MLVITDKYNNDKDRYEASFDTSTNQWSSVTASNRDYYFEYKWNTGTFTTISLSMETQQLDGTMRKTGASTLTGALDANGGASIDNVQIG